MKPPKGFTYYGIDVRPLAPNSTGLRYETSIMNDEVPRLRADTKEGIKQMIREALGKEEQ